MAIEGLIEAHPTPELTDEVLCAVIAYEIAYKDNTADAANEALYETISRLEAEHSPAEIAKSFSYAYQLYNELKRVYE